MIWYNVFGCVCMWGTILPISAVAPLYSCIFSHVQLAHERNESEVIEETSPPLPFKEGQQVKRSVLFCFCLWIFPFVVCHESHWTELVSNNSTKEIPALAVARNRTFLDWLVHCLMPKYSLNADIPLSIPNTYTQLQTLELQSVILWSRVFGEDLDWGAYFLYLFLHIHKSALGSGCGAQKKLQGKSEFETLRNRRKQVIAIKLSVWHLGAR